MMNKRLADGWLTTVLILSVYAWTMSLATQRSQPEWRDPSPHAARFANVGKLRLHLRPDGHNQQRLWKSLCKTVLLYPKTAVKFAETANCT